MRILAFIFTFSACTHSTVAVDDIEKDAGNNQKHDDQWQAQENNEAFISKLKDPDACVPQKFASDMIPSGFVYDPSCPPVIYDPPKWIPKWDPSPIINEYANN